MGFLHCSFSLVGMRRPESRNEQRYDSHAFSYVMIHIGQLIEQTLKEQGRTVTWFAGRLCCTRPNVCKIFKNDNIDIKHLSRISDILQVDFFAVYARQIRNSTSVSKKDIEM